MILPRWSIPLAGALSALALPPVYAVPVLWLTLPLLLNAVDRSESAKSAFFRGWLWGTGFFAAGLYWIAFALLVDAARFGWLIPFAIGGLGAVLGVYIGVVAALTWCARPGWPRLLVFAGAWGAAEGLRAELFTGFPWNPLGSVWGFSAVMMQSVSIIGCFGLGLITAAVAGAPVLLLRTRRQGIAAAGTGVLVLAALAGWGAWRLPAGPAPVQPGIRLRLVQANIEQTLKWRPEMRARNLFQQVELSKLPSAEPITHVIWPETAAPSFLEEDPRAREILASAIPPGGLMLAGSVRGTAEGQEPFRIWNSLRAIDAAGTIVASFDKAHLVPFGEYMPLPRWLPISKITVGSVDFTPGPGPATLDLPGLPPVAPLICFEDIFPAEAVDRAKRPAWMVNVTNDGWFGISSGPYQHFVAARMRAVEEGLPLIRAANTGISAAVDPYGRVVAELGLDRSGVVDTALPQPLGETIFARFGRTTSGILSLLLIFAGFAERKWSRPRQSS